MIYKASLGPADALGSCCGSGLPSTVSPHRLAEVRLDGCWVERWRTEKSRICMILESIDVASGPEAVLQPDHRHKLTTCVLVQKPDKLPQLGNAFIIPLAGFVLENDE